MRQSPNSSPKVPGNTFLSLRSGLGSAVNASFLIRHCNKQNSTVPVLSTQPELMNNFVFFCIRFEGPSRVVLYFSVFTSTCIKVLPPQEEGYIAYL